ncbi:MAG: type II secretion system GspH family protein [Actinobacteria bacterium]|nr:type II secretion system GspH family protein [Actinomycetota bacterium]MCL5446865.1 type II secretion system GspH family protein [Actinomycetota bacterium]
MTSMLERLRSARAVSLAGEQEAEEGFTLIELMVVLLIMGILLAIAIPTFLGVTGSAKDKGAQSDLTNADTTGKVFYENNVSYNAASDSSPMSSGYLQSAEPQLQFVAQGAANSAKNQVWVLTSTNGNSAMYGTWSPTGVCWLLVDNEGGTDSSMTAWGSPSPGTHYGYYLASGPGSCTAQSPTANGGSGWQTSWPAAPAGK